MSGSGDVVDSPGVLAGALRGLIGGGPLEPVGFEGILASAVRLVWLDRSAVSVAVGPSAGRPTTAVRLALARLADALAGRSRGPGSARNVLVTESGQDELLLDVIPLRRVYEIAARVFTDPVPCLLATPDGPGGLLGPAVLRDRLAEHAAAGTVPWPDDAEQAMLRLPRAIPAAERAALRAAAGLAGPGPGLAGAAEFVLWQHREIARRRLHDTDFPGVPATRPARPAVLPGALAGPLAGVHPVAAARGVAELGWRQTGHRVLWPSVAPAYPDVVAAHLVHDLFHQCGPDAVRPTVPLLAILGEGADAPLGRVGSVAVAYGLAAAFPADRAAAVAALVAQAGRGWFDAGLLAEPVAWLWRRDVTYRIRLGHGLREAAAAGLAREMQEVTLRTLDDLADDPGQRGLADLVTLAADCAGRAGVRGEPPVAEVVRRPREVLGSSGGYGDRPGDDPRTSGRKPW
ncbi:hypothetical protein [Streptomyces smaragdinus]|nr:hypothetical protein [Streptomyces smaragdinus]